MLERLSVRLACALTLQLRAKRQLAPTE